MRSPLIPPSPCDTLSPTARRAASTRKQGAAVGFDDAQRWRLMTQIEQPVGFPLGDEGLWRLREYAKLFDAAAAGSARS